MTKQVRARELSGKHIGEHILQTVTHWKTAVYDRELGKYTTPPDTTDVWFEINMILHKKDGTVRVRTRQGERHYLPAAMVEML